MPLAERSYGSDCRIFTPDDATSRFAVVRATVLDEFVVAHIMGWWAKALLLRRGGAARSVADRGGADTSAGLLQAPRHAVAVLHPV